MTGPDRIFARKWPHSVHFEVGTWSATHHSGAFAEYIRRAPGVLAALPEVQALIAAEREACARLVDCGCDAAKKAAVLRADNGTERARACGEYACGADDAAAIRKRTEGKA